MKSKSTIITEPDPSRASSSRFVPPRRDRGALAVAVDVDPAVVCAADDARERRDVLREEREQNGRRSDRDSRIERHLSEDGWTEGRARATTDGDAPSTARRVAGPRPLCTATPSRSRPRSSRRPRTLRPTWGSARRAVTTRGKR
eukprot:29100-Pelagococcus_subviridis.AAC.5